MKKILGQPRSTPFAGIGQSKKMFKLRAAVRLKYVQFDFLSFQNPEAPVLTFVQNYTFWSMISYDSTFFSTQDSVEAGTPFDFCRRDGSTEARSGKMHVPVSSCSGTTLRGELASCTPVQDSYDRVRVSLHRREDGREGDCGVNDHSAEGKVLEVEAPLSRINRTHGSFVASFDGEGRTGRLGEDGENVSYCLKLELVDHPYCQADHQIGQSSSPVPKVCSTHVLKPLKMGAGGCGGTPSSSAAVLSRTRVNAGIIATVVLVSAAFLATLLFLSRRKRNSPPARDEMDEEEKQAGGGIIKQNAPLIVSAPSDDGRKVFLLHFSEKNRPEKFAKVNAALRQWISAASGAEVFDPSDEARQEEVAAEQEGWAERLLLDKACACNRVVVVDGPAAAAALPDGGGGGGETAPLNGGGGDDDPLQDLKVAALRHLQSPTFVGDYSRLALVTYSPASSSCSALANLTSMRSHLRLPEHLPELAAWLAGAASSSSKGAAAAAAEETRLRSAIRSLDTTAASNGHAAGHALA